jgi:integrase/recombinase XerD
MRLPYREIDLVYPKRPVRLPLILSEEEVARLIESATTSYHRVILMTLYRTGLRREELCRLKVTDVDSQRMVIHVRQGKGNRDRDVTLSPRLLEVLRAYWHWRKPKTYLFPSHYRCRREQPISSHTVWYAVREAARRADIKKKVSPHLLHSARSKTSRLQMVSVTHHDGPIQGQSRLRAVPFNELVDGMSISASRLGRA